MFYFPKKRATFMSDEKWQQTEPIHIDANVEGDRWVVLTPDDEDRFIKSCSWVAEASKLGMSHELYLRELHGTLSHVRKWAEKHSDSVQLCFAMPRNAQIAIYVVPTGGKYDFSLSTELTALDIELAEKFQSCRCDVLQVPDKREQIDNLTGQNMAILIYGNSERSSHAVAP
jgi:hypothetical protein